MRPTASADEIRAAYRLRARRAHPDLVGADRPGEMAALNEAWRVLGDPSRRRAYDAGLVAGVTAPPPRPSSPSPSVADGPEPWPAGDGSAPRAGLLAGLPWLVVLTLLAVIFVFTAYATGGGRGTRSEPLDGVVRAGDCVRLLTGHPAQEVACAATHDAVVAAVIAPVATCPPATQLALGPVGAERVCLRPG